MIDIKAIKAVASNAEAGHTPTSCQPQSSPCDEIERLRDKLAQADKDFSDGCMVVHLQVADQMRRKYEPVLRLALEALSTCSGVPHWPSIEQVKESIKKALG